jgi:hypothetical protein
MGPRNAYKEMLDNVVSPITCVGMNHQNQLEQMANGAMFSTQGRTKSPRRHLIARNQIHYKKFTMNDYMNKITTGILP